MAITKDQLIADLAEAVDAPKTTVRALPVSYTHLTLPTNVNV